MSLWLLNKKEDEEKDKQAILMDDEGALQKIGILRLKVSVSDRHSVHLPDGWRRRLETGRDDQTKAAALA